MMMTMGSRALLVVLLVSLFVSLGEAFWVGSPSVSQTCTPTCLSYQDPRRAASDWDPFHRHPNEPRVSDPFYYEQTATSYDESSGNNSDLFQQLNDLKNKLALQTYKKQLKEEEVDTLQTRIQELTNRLDSQTQQMSNGSDQYQITIDQLRESHALQLHEIQKRADEELSAGTQQYKIQVEQLQQQMEELQQQQQNIPVPQLPSQGPPQLSPPPTATTTTSSSSTVDEKDHSQYQATIDNLRESYADQLFQIQTAANEEKKLLQEQIADLKQQHERMVEELTSKLKDSEAQYSASTRNNNNVQEEERYQETVSKLQESYANQLFQIQKNADEEMEVKMKQYETRLFEYKTQIETLQAELNDSSQYHNKMADLQATVSRLSVHVENSQRQNQQNELEIRQLQYEKTSLRQLVENAVKVMGTRVSKPVRDALRNDATRLSSDWAARPSSSLKP